MRTRAPVQPSWSIALPPAPAGTWYVCGAGPVDDMFRSGSWHLLIQGLRDRAAAEDWIREHGPQLEDLGHFAVDVHAPAPGETHWETFYSDRDGCVYSARTGRRL